MPNQTRTGLKRVARAVLRRIRRTPSEEDQLLAAHFDAAYYLEAYPEVASSGVDPLTDYLTEGWKQGRNPCRAFSTNFYLATNDDVREHGMNPFLHYLLYGQREGRRPMKHEPNPFRGLEGLTEIVDKIAEEFDEEYYRWMYPDVEANGGHPLAHYIRFGWREGRNPNADFDTNYYLQSNPDVEATDINPFYHYLLRGREEGRKPSGAAGFGSSTIPFSVSNLNPKVSLPIALGRTSEKFDSDAQPKILVHVHVFYLEGLDKVLRRLRAVPQRFDLFVTTDSEKKAERVRASIKETELDCSVDVALGPNRGRDIAPFLVSVAPRMHDYDLGLHLHVKKSMEKEEVGIVWLEHNLKCLLHDRVYVDAVLKLFEHEQQCGIVLPKLFAPIRPFIHWSQNKPLAKRFLESIGVPSSLTDDDLVFPVGMMFWFRPQALKQLSEFDGGYDYFPEEPIADDATVAHAIERSINYIAKHNGYHYRVIHPLFGEQMPRPESTPEVSIILPVYNAETYLHHAVQSLLHQNDGIISTEILLVDNNSTDGSLAIARFYESVYPHVRVFEQKTQGAGAARNMGLDHARGEYVTFLDSDDMLSVDGIELLYTAATQHDADIVSSRLRMFDEEQIHQDLPPTLGLHGVPIDIRYYATPRTNYWIDAPILKELQAIFADFGACAKLYRRTFLEEKRLRFKEGVNFEDNEFVYTAYLNASAMMTIQRTTYYYRKYQQESGSTQSTEKSTSAMQDQLAAIDAILGRIDAVDNEQLLKVIHSSLIQKIAWQLDGVETLPVHLLPLREPLRATLERLDTVAILGDDCALLQLLEPTQSIAR